MDTQFSINSRFAQRVAIVMTLVVLTLAASPFFIFATAGATQFSTRSITMNDSSPSGNANITSGVGSGVNVTYKVTFTTTNPSQSSQSMVIDFCREDPIINDTCTRPTGMTYPSGVTNISGTVGGWTLTGSNGQVKLAGGTAIATNTVQSFELTGITNPSTTGTFYARMYTYNNNAFGTYQSPALAGAGTGIGNFVDYGGIAMSTASVITITARVQEQLTFCVSGSNPDTWTSTHNCDDGSVSLPAVVLGHGTPTPVLDANTLDTGSVYTLMSTNATTGATIRMRNSNLICGGLSADAGSTCAIPGQGTVTTHNTTPDPMPTGTASFGLFVADGRAGSGDTASVGSATTLAGATYHDQTPSSAHVDVTKATSTNTADRLWYGMDNDTSTGVTSAYGSTVVAASAPNFRVVNDYLFAAAAALTTPAGIYTANLSMICTGTF